MNELQDRRPTVIQWLKESVTAKMLFITLLILLLLIPSAMVQNLINERASRQVEMMSAVSDQWSGSQLIRGPVLTIPYKRHVYSDSNKSKLERDVIENLHLLPNSLMINADLKTERLHRGIFEVVVYNSLLKVSGNFLAANVAEIGITADQLMPEKATLSFSVSDMKGLKTNPVVTIAGQSLTAEPVFDSSAPFGNGLQISIDLSSSKNGEIPFNFNLDLKGSQELSFFNLGKTTAIELKGNWTSPSFDGHYLPDLRTVDKDGFVANWKLLYFNRPYPQQWINDDKLLDNEKKEAEASFGVKLRLPIDQYQKTMRTSKYSLLIIILTFISLFLTEIIRKQTIHFFNYLLIGAAMIIYYSLLLSFSEQIGFNAAYLVASVATVALITTFIGSLLKNKHAAVLFGFILSVFYTFIFVIIQLEDYALMIGSLALFLVIGILMYFSRKINWDKN